MILLFFFLLISLVQGEYIFNSNTPPFLTDKFVNLFLLFNTHSSTGRRGGVIYHETYIPALFSSSLSSIAWNIYLSPSSAFLFFFNFNSFRVFFLEGRPFLIPFPPVKGEYVTLYSSMDILCALRTCFRIPCRLNSSSDSHTRHLNKIFILNNSSDSHTRHLNKIFIFNNSSDSHTLHLNNIFIFNNSSDSHTRHLNNIFILNNSSDSHTRHLNNIFILDSSSDSHIYFGIFRFSG